MLVAGFAQVFKAVAHVASQNQEGLLSGIAHFVAVLKNPKGK